MAPDRVLDDLDERVHVDVEELPVQAGRRVRGAHQRAGRRRVEAALEAVLELAPVEGEEVRALLALDVDDLDVLARAHLVGERGRRVDAEVEPRLGQRGGSSCSSSVRGVARRTSTSSADAGGAPSTMRPPGAATTTVTAALGAERLRRPGRRPLAEQPDRDAPPAGRARARRARARGSCRRAPRARPGGPSPGRRPARRAPRRRRAPSAPSTVSSATWPPSRSMTVTRSSGPSPNTVAPPGRTQYVSRNGSSGRSPRTSADVPGAPRQASRAPSPPPRPPAAMSCSASSRLPSASSFLTSFSTTRRL